MEPEVEIKTEVFDDEDPLSLNDIDQMKVEYVFHEDVYIKEEPELDLVFKTEDDVVYDDIKKSPNELTSFESNEDVSDGTNDSEQQSTDTDVPQRKIFKRDESDDVKADAFLQEFLAVAKQKKIDSLLTRYFFTVNKLMDLSLHYMIVKFKYKENLDTIEPKSFDNFLEYMRSTVTDAEALEVEESTRGGSDELWNELRYGRVTDSKIFHATRSVADQNLIESLIGIRKERPVRLIDGVVNEIRNKLKLNVEKCGFFLSNEYPMMGAAPDAVSNDYVIKIKKSDHLEKYVQNGKISLRYLCQLQMQAHFAKRKKAMLCVAPTDYETSKKLNIYIFVHNPVFCKKLLKDAYTFWKDVMFDRLWDTV